MPKNAALTMASTIGLKDLVIAPLTKDDDTGVTYGDLQAVAGAVEATIAPQNADPDIQYYDDVEGDVVYPDPEITLTTKLANIPLKVQEMIFGNYIDDNGVLVRSAGDKPEYFAVGFRSEMSNKKFRYVWLFKCRATPSEESYATKEGTDITRQTVDVEWTAIKRTFDDKYQAVADEGQNGFEASAAKTFLDTVYEPTAKPGIGG